ncbi:MAG: DUF554 domain-containing protein, partial [Acidimicrobiia bacterium]
MATVVAGTGVGVLLHGRLPERVRTTVLDGIGILVVALGVSSFLETRNAVFPVIAIVAGGIVGELARIEDRLEAIGERLRRRVEGDADPPVRSYVERDADEVEVDHVVEPVDGRSFVDGFVVASLTFSVGAMMVVGSLQDGISGDSELLIVKSVLDGLVSVVFAAVFGWGVGFSALSIAVVQGSFT